MSGFFTAKGGARSLTMLFVLHAAIAVRAQDPPQYAVLQAVVDGLRSPAQCAQIDLFLRAQPDVIVARTDYNTRNVMIQVPAFSSTGREQLKAWFTSLGLEIHCYRRYPLTSAVYTPLDPRTCIEEAVPVR